MQHCPARAAQRLAAAVLALCLVLALAVPHAHAAALQETHGIRMLDFNTSQILSIGNQTSGKCSWYALRYARTILDGKVSSGSGMWSNGAVWSAGGYYGYSGSLSECLQKLYTELSAGKPVIVHLKNTAVNGVKRHSGCDPAAGRHYLDRQFPAENGRLINLERAKKLTLSRQLFCLQFRSIPFYREAPLPWVGRQILLADAGDLDIIAFLDHGEQPQELFRVALHFQRHAAVVLVLHPAGQFQRLGRIAGAVAEAHPLHLPFDGVAAAHSAFRQGGRRTIFFV